MKPSKSQQKTTFKPLSIEQQNAIDLLILGKSDTEVAEAVGVNRTTIWEWRTAHPILMATPERGRADVWRQPQERLRSLLSKSVENLAAAVEADGTIVKSSINHVARKPCCLWVWSHAPRETDGKGNTCTLRSKAIGAAGSSFEEYFTHRGQETHHTPEKLSITHQGHRGVAGHAHEHALPWDH